MSIVTVPLSLHTHQVPEQPVPVTADTKSLLAKLADPVLVELEALYTLAPDANAAYLRQHLSALLQQFEQQAKLAGVPALKVLTARYILCSVLDEAILYTAWGQENHWDENSLLSLFHNDTWGGEQVFIILNKALQEQNFNLDILELIYICLSLGFEGQYRIMNDGAQQLQRLRQELWHILRVETGAIADLSIQQDKSPTIRRNVLFSFWPALLTGSILLIASYTGLYTLLSNHVASLTTQLQQAMNATAYYTSTSGGQS